MKIYITYNLEEKLNKYHSFEVIENYDKVVYMISSHNQLSSLPKLPNSLKILYCGHNNLTILPKLPNSLQKLCCWNNQLTSLPDLPD